MPFRKTHNIRLVVGGALRPFTGRVARPRRCAYRESVGRDSNRGVTVFDLFENAERLIEARLRRANPEVTPAEIKAAIDEWAHGDDRRLDADGYLREVPIPAHWQ